MKTPYIIELAVLPGISEDISERNGLSPHRSCVDLRRHGDTCPSRNSGSPDGDKYVPRARHKIAATSSKEIMPRERSTAKWLAYERRLTSSHQVPDNKGSKAVYDKGCS